MAQQLKVFVSHSHEDDAFCRTLVDALRQAEADVWYDQHNLGSGQLLDTIGRELRERPVFVLILSPAALHSQQVRDETMWAYARFQRDPSRLLLPVLAAPLPPLPQEDAIWLCLQDVTRVEAPDLLHPSAPTEVARRTLSALALTPADEAAIPAAPQPTDESANELITRGKALQAQGKHADALPLLQRATHLAPTSFAAWFTVASALTKLKRYQEALPAHVCATTLDPTASMAWTNRGWALNELKRHADALVALDRALALDPNLAFAWTNTATVLNELKRADEALAAYDRALALDPTLTSAWNNKGSALIKLKRYGEALVALDRARALDPYDAYAWTNTATVLNELKRADEALAAYDRALALDPNLATPWNNKGWVLYKLKRYEEALVAYDRALALSQNSVRWRNKAAALRALGRIVEAEQAEQRAKDLGR